MRISCELKVSNRGASGGGRASRGTVSLGKVSSQSDVVELQVCTAQQKHGMRFRVANGNIAKIYGRFIKEGKATISVQEPAKDIFISNADPTVLHSFLTALNEARNGVKSSVEPKADGAENKAPPVRMAVLQPAKTKHFTKAGKETSMDIASNKEYPFVQGFPKTLRELNAVNCDLKRFDRRLQKLPSLFSLNLAGNKLGSRIDLLNFEGMRSLTQLDLSGNGISEANLSGSQFWDSICRLRLAKLSLARNAIACVPEQFFVRLSASLRSVNLSANKLTQIPLTIGYCSRLSLLNLSGNQIAYFPGTLSWLRLEHLDISENRAVQAGQRTQDELLRHEKVIQPGFLPRLMDLCARVILEKKLRLDLFPELIQDYLKPFENFPPCTVCRRRCILSPSEGSNVVRSVNYDTRKISSTSSMSQGHESRVSLQGFVCSNQCLDDFRRNRF